ncbi:MAG: UDP-N-acetylmuramate:L-alanyl-gamma-D-glutamyl-meso-diaminopimelate ligase [Myxococcales bacterium]|nr:UDP-N-acetylmuramate:L-alanyl-gamma-D-glutamyl-meso-diaminopimelate ligase [Myxococcales bacterium]MCB9580075.1 UDP-N-acetylmuramate:L-alanyl-gamma-D-glutamyl-meso-diaminopimelate ligase [Polyangiaceae bacterium]
MRVHIVAVAGTGMGSLAGLLKELGHDVSGSDVAFDPPMGPALESWGVRCLSGFDAAHLDPAPDLVVVGNVCRKNNPEAVAAFERGLDVTHIAGALRRFALGGTAPLVVAGTHGKTTTSAMAAWLLDAVGLAPGFMIGGLPKNFSQSFRAAKTEPRRLSQMRAVPFVLEGDEYDTAYFEKTAKFLHYGAEVAIITSIEHDHIDIYPTEESYLEAFRRFVATVPESGVIVANAGDARVVEIVNAHAKAPVGWYALEGESTHGMPPHWLAAPAENRPEGTTFDLFAGGVAAGRFVLPSPGRHNLKNALAAIAAAAQGYGARLGDLATALARFEGVRRRQDLIGEPGGIFVYDDFAHHPTAVRETLMALRQRHPEGRLFAVFEPRSATACRNLHQQAYAESFGDADEVHLAPLGRAGLADDERLDTARLARELGAKGTPTQNHESLDAILALLTARARPGDVIALLSNGAFGGIHAKLLSALG